MKNEPQEKQPDIHVERSGAVATTGSVAAGAGGYAAGRDIIIYHPTKQEPIILPIIQSVLRKEDYDNSEQQGEFFKDPPEWIDFKDGYVVERREVDKIIQKLENEKIQLILGAPASGKSVILKNVGLKLAERSKNVYIIELKRYAKDRVEFYFKNILKINDENVTYIVDDAHLYLKECENLISDFRSIGKGKLVIGSRETREITEEGSEEEYSEFKYLIRNKKYIYIQAEDATEEMIRCFLKRKHREHNFSEERINTVSTNLEKYKKDLWFLSWALIAYDPNKDTVEENEIYEKIKSKIRKINAEDVFLLMSVFYRFEIPIERSFLEEQMNIKEDAIDELIGLSEIVETEDIGRKRMLSLNHSSIAELYFGAYQRYPDLGKDIRKNILNQKDEEYLEYLSFYRYITGTDPRNAVNVVFVLGTDWFNEKGGHTLIGKFAEDNRIQNSILKGIEKEEDIGKIGSCMAEIENVDLNLANSIDIDVFLSKIEKEEDIEKIGQCMLKIAYVSEEVGLKLANGIDIDTLVSKIEKEEDIGKIGSCVADIIGISEEVGLKLMKNVVILRYSSNICEKVVLKLANSIDIDAVSSKIEKEEDIGKIGSCVADIADSAFEMSSEVGWKLANSIANSIYIDTLLSKIEKEEDIEKIGRCMLEIAYVSEEVGLKLANGIDIDTLVSKIEKEEDIGKIGRCVSDIARVSEEVGLKLVDSVSSKVEKEEDIGKIGSCVADIADREWEMSIEVGWKLANSIANSIYIDALLSKIEKEEDIGTIGVCVWRITEASEDVARDLVNRLNPKLTEELNKAGWLDNLS